MKNDKSIKRNALISGIKTLAAVIFPLVTFPYVSRVLGADNLGKVTFSNSIVNYFLLFAGLGISQYAIREGSALRDKPERLKRFVDQIFTINLSSTILAYVLLFIMIKIWPGSKSYQNLILIQSLTIICTTVGCEYIYAVYENYFYITIRTVLMQIFSLFLLLYFVREKNDYIKYAFVTVLAMGGSNIFSYFHLKKYVKPALTATPCFRKHLPSLIILFGNAVAATIYVNSDITLLGVLKSDYEVGIYSVSVKIYSILKQMLNSIIIVSLPRLSYYLTNKKEAEYNRLLTQILHALIIFISPIVVGGIVLSKNIIELVAGNDYLPGHSSLKLLMVALLFSILATFFTTSVLLPNRKEKMILKAAILSASVNFILNFLMIPYWGERGAAFTTIVAELTVMVTAKRYSKNCYKIKLNSNIISESLIGCIIIVFLCKLLIHGLTSNVLIIILSVALSGLAYLVVLLLFKDPVIISVFRTLKSIKNH